VSLAFSVIRLYNQANMSRPFQLFRLQQLDSQIDGTTLRLKEIETALADDSGLREAQIKLDQAAEALHQAQKALRNAEFESQQQRIKIEQTESTLYGGKVRNPKELKDLELEAAALKRHKAVLEDRQFERMVAEEEATEAHKSVSAEFEQARSHHTLQHQNLLKEKGKLEKDVAHLQDERRAAQDGIPPEDLQLYNQVRQKRRGIAVARVVDRACTACGSTLNAALLSAAHSPNELHQCDTCGRILYIG